MLFIVNKRGYISILKIRMQLYESILNYVYHIVIYAYMFLFPFSYTLTVPCRVD